MTGPRFNEPRWRQADYKESGPAQLRHITDCADRIRLGMNGTLIIAAAGTAISHLIRGHRNNFAGLADQGQMTGVMCLALIRGTFEEVFWNMFSDP